MITAQGQTFPAFKIEDVTSNGTTFSGKLSHNNDPLDNFSPGIDTFTATVKFRPNKGTAQGTWQEVGFIGRQGSLEFKRIDDPNQPDGPWTGLATIDGVAQNIGAFVTSGGRLTRGKLDLDGFGSILRRGLGARAVQGGPLTSATADADGAAFAGPAGNFSGSFVKKNTRLQGTYTAPSGTTVPLTLYHHLQKKAGLPKLTSIEPGTIAPGQTQTFTIIGKRFSGDVIPVLEDASLEIVDFEVQGKTLTVTLKATNVASSGDQVDLNVIDRAGRNAKKSLTILVQ